MKRAILSGLLCLVLSVIGLVIPLTLVRGTVLPHDWMIAHWSLDETPAENATVILDSLAGNHDGVLLTNDALQKSIPGVFGTGLMFDGVDDYVTIPDSANWDLGISAWSIAAWCYFPVFPGWQQVLISHGYYYSGWGIWPNGTRMDIHSNAVAAGWDNVIVLNQWTHYVFASDGSEVELYVNGVSQGEIAYGSGWMQDSDSPLIIGAEVNGGRSINVGLDEVYICDERVSDEEVLVLYGCGEVEIATASLISATGARLNGSVTATGLEDPHVRVYWGDNDGTDNVSAWDFSSDPTSPMQHQGVATWFKDVSALVSASTYYCRASVENSQGTLWAESSSAFVTLVGTGGPPGEGGPVGSTDLAPLQEALMDSLYLVTLCLGSVVFLVMSTGWRGALWALVSALCSIGFILVAAGEEMPWLQVVAAVVLGLAILSLIRGAVRGRP
jgi:hypothetical protein